MKAFFEKMIALFLAVLSALGISLTTPETPEAPTVKPTGSDVYVIDGGTVTFAFASNPTTGYTWEVAQDGTSVKQTKDWYEAEPEARGKVATAGSGGTQYYTFEAVAAGKTTLTFNYLRPWETEGPIKSHVAVVTVDKDLKITDVTIAN